MNMSINIAIDGYSSCGKGTIAKACLFWLTWCWHHKGFEVVHLSLLHDQWHFVVAVSNFSVKLFCCKHLNDDHVQSTERLLGVSARVAVDPSNIRFALIFQSWR